MAKPTRKTLPKDFEALLDGGDLNALKTVYDTCLPDAKGGVFKQSAIAFWQCPDALAHWLVTDKGADIESGDRYGSSPLYSRAGARLRSPDSHFETLITLGAYLNAGENARGTPLHAASRAAIIENAEVLLRHGAKVDALDNRQHTPLKSTLIHAANADLAQRLPYIQLLIEAGAQITPDMQEDIQRIGENFEFHRAGFNSDLLSDADAALQALYQLFGVSPVERRILHDGTALIHIPSGKWQEQFAALWDTLVPSSGPAQTVQGEVIRIAGRIADEIDRNGGANWDRAYRAMANSFAAHVQSGVSLAADRVLAVQTILSDLPHASDDAALLGAYAVEWVINNPNPAPLPPPSYNR